MADPQFQFENTGDGISTKRAERNLRWYCVLNFEFASLRFFAFTRRDTDILDLRALTLMMALVYNLILNKKIDCNMWIDKWIMLRIWGHKQWFIGCAFLRNCVRFILTQSKCLTRFNLISSIDNALWVEMRSHNKDSSRKSLKKHDHWLYTWETNCEW